MHDTPPPTKFGDGSFNAQLREDLEIKPAGGGRFIHRCVPTDAEPPFIAHVKVLKGNGDEIYFEEFAEGSVIKIELADVDGDPAGDLEIFGDANYFQIDCDSKMNGPGQGNKHRKRYEHPGKGKDFHISRIIVEQPAGSVQLDEVAPMDHEEEYQVMVWHIGDLLERGTAL